MSCNIIDIKKSSIEKLLSQLYKNKDNSILFGTGCGITILLLIAIQNAPFGVLILILLPALITGFLVMPVRYYHNVLQLITNIVTFYGNRRKYYWRGWCMSDESESD